MARSFSLLYEALLLYICLIGSDRSASETAKRFLDFGVTKTYPRLSIRITGSRVFYYSPSRDLKKIVPPIIFRERIFIKEVKGYFSIIPGGSDRFWSSVERRWVYKMVLLPRRRHFTVASLIEGGSIFYWTNFRSSYWDCKVKLKCWPALLT